jgi:hypothetical protein
MATKLDSAVNFGPLELLIGTWESNQGVDIAPDPDGTERNEYHETLVFECVGDVENAEEQLLAIVRYHQSVYRNRDDKRIHDETGYWMWNSDSNTIMHSFSIPRGVSVVATGTVSEDQNGTCLDVNASEGGISETVFMAEKASTKAFSRSITVSENQLSYEQTTTVDIYGKVFEHTDQNCLQKQ